MNQITDITNSLLTDFDQAKRLFSLRRDPELISLIYEFYEKHQRSEDFISWILESNIKEAGIALKFLYS